MSTQSGIRARGDVPGFVHRLVALVMTSLTLLSLGMAPALAQSRKAPNILFILTDNLGYGELGVYGGGATRGAPG
jgi:arylsulfatase